VTAAYSKENAAAAVAIQERLNLCLLRGTLEKSGGRPGSITAMEVQCPEEGGTELCTARQMKGVLFSLLY
jgi:hypothetical protein